MTQFEEFVEELRMIKWGRIAVIIFVGFVIYAITIGYMGGAKSITTKYYQIMRGEQPVNNQ